MTVAGDGGHRAIKARNIWEWDGDCRDDSNRFSSVDEFALRAGIDAGMVEVRTMEERIEADSAE